MIQLLSYPLLPANEEDIAEVEKMIGHKIPNIYKEFLRIMNGACMDLCVLYGTEDMIEMYECNELEEYAPEYISIGNNNGDGELLIRAEENALKCAFFDAGEIGSNEPEVWEWFDFCEWVERGCPMEEDDQE